MDPHRGLLSAGRAWNTFCPGGISCCFPVVRQRRCFSLIETHFGRTQLIIGPLWGSFGSVVLEIAESWSEFGCILNTQVTKAVLYSLLGIAWLWVLTAGVLVWSHSPLCHPSTRSLFFSAIVSLTQRLDAQKKEKDRPCARAFLCCSLKAHYLKVFISVQPFIQTQTF